MKQKILKTIMLCMLLIFSSFVIILNPVNALSASSDVIYHGIDVSVYQREIDYAKVKMAGIDIVYIKASEGRTLKDPYFEINYQNAKNNGLKVGFYHFIRARNEKEAVKEAEFFASVIEGKEPECRLAMDFEIFGSLTNEEINYIATVFLEKVQELTGKEMVIYSNTYNARNIFSLELAQKYPLWVAQYGVSTPGDNGKWNDWVGFQYSSMGRINGINGYVDLDKYTDGIFLSTEEVIPTPSDPNENIGQMVTYTVKRGDTLTKIALKYNTTVEEIVSLNNIQNPNLIYPGQVLKIPSSNNANYNSVTETTNEIFYTVRRGDNLWKIANRYRITIASIVSINDIQNPNLIYPGQTLLIRREIRNEDHHGCGYIFYIVGRGDNLSYIASRYRTTVRNIVTLNDIKNPNLIYPGQIIRIN